MCLFRTIYTSFFTTSDDDFGFSTSWKNQSWARTLVCEPTASRREAEHDFNREIG
jgi:hypothetical protein